VIETSIDCDPLGDRIDEIIIEQGSARAASLRVFRLARDAKRGYAVTRLEVRVRYSSIDPQRYEVAERIDVDVGHAAIDEGRIQPALLRVRASLRTAAREAPAASGSSGPPAGSNSDGFLAGIVLRDHEGRTVERYHVAAHGADSETEGLPIQLAEAALMPALEAAALTPGDPTDADRAFYTGRFRVSARRFHRTRAPAWTRQAYVALTGRVGTRALVPELIETARRDEDARTRYLAVNALAALTEWDARYDGKHVAVPLDRAALAYATECRP
jgi:hypothetical protein